MSAVIDPALERSMAARLAAVARAAERTDARRTLFVVVREPDLQALVRGLARLLALTPDDERTAWWANFTKVRLFAGHPGRAAVAPLLRCIESDAMGFALVDAEARHPRLADLLAPLRTRDGPAPGDDREIVWDGGAGRWDLEIDVRGLDWPRYLVHVVHLLAEAALTDANFGGRIALRHLAQAPVCDEDVAQARLDLDVSPPTCRATLRPRRTNARA